MSVIWHERMALSTSQGGELARMLWFKSEGGASARDLNTQAGCVIKKWHLLASYINYVSAGDEATTTKYDYDAAKTRCIVIKCLIWQPVVGILPQNWHLHCINVIKKMFGSWQDIFKVISSYEIIKFKHKNNYIDIKKEWRPKITV